MKIKPLNLQQITISIDRLTRFKNPEDKYLRVFQDLILHNLISPNFSRVELDNMDYKSLAKYAQEIINYSLSKITGNLNHDFSINKKLKNYETSLFFIDDETEKLLNNEINFAQYVPLINMDTAPNNLKWLKVLSSDEDVKSLRNSYFFKFPVEIVVIVEGTTEEMLLPVFARLCNFNFDQNGVYILPAGGKNQVVKFYYELSKKLKIPIFVLLDKDGKPQAEEIQLRIRNNDKIHVIESGEFEDLLADYTVEKTLSFALENISEINEEIKANTGHRVEYLEEVFKHRGMHEFKKVEFSNMIKNNINSKNDITPEISQIIEEIKVCRLKVGK